MSILSIKSKLNALLFCSVTLFIHNAAAKETSFWQVKNCRISGTSADITLSTDATISHNKIHFRLISAVPLKDAPELQLNTARFTGFDLEGSGRGFGFEVEYSPVQVSYLLKPQATLVAAYDPIYTDEDGHFYTYHAAFPMQKLPKLIAQISENCHPYNVTQR